MNFICWQSPSGSHGPAYPGTRVIAADAQAALAAFSSGAGISSGQVYCIPETQIVAANVGGVTLVALPPYI